MTPRLCMHLLFFAALLAHDSPWALDRLPDEQQLPTELKVSGPLVYFRAPFGRRYRPGCAFPLEIRVYNPGQAFSGEVCLCEDPDDDAARSGSFKRVQFGSREWRAFTLAARAPAVSADLHVVVREYENGGAVGRVCYRGILSDYLTPLPANARNILFCGRGGGMQLGDLSKIQQVAARDFPQEAWMYESLDLVVLSDASFAAAPEAAKLALRRWLLGGGRLFVTSVEALQPALEAGLLPVREARAERDWWLKTAGLRPADIVVENGPRLVYVRLFSGLGSAVIPVPGSNPETDAASKAFSSAALQNTAERHPDERLQSERFKAFTYRSSSPARGKGAITWFALGALMFCLIMVLCLGSRSKIETLGLPVALLALLAVMLAHFFSAPELVLSRVTWLQASADGAALRQDEWTLAEAFHSPQALLASGPSGGAVLPLFGSTAELRRASGDLLQQPDQFKIDNLGVSPERPALIHSSRLLPPLSPADGQALFASADGKLKLALAATPPGCLQRKAAIYITENGDFWLLENLDASTGFVVKKFEDAQSACRAAGGSPSGAVVAARATVLSWATRAAARSGRNTLILWGDALENAPSPSPALQVDNPGQELASHFLVYSAETRSKN
jgi:hypothetical protein